MVATRRSAAKKNEKNAKETVEISDDEIERLNKLDDGDGFIWSYTDEPHATRRKEILKKYPEMKKLFGIDPYLKWKILLAVTIQFIMAYNVRDQSWSIVMLLAYIVGGTINHSMLLAIHELSHNLGFKTPIYNKLYAVCVAGAPIGVPSAILFKRYHLEHHRYQGEHIVDTDIPTSFEVRVFNNWWKKIFWVILQPAFYALRPVFVNPKTIGKWEIFNTSYCIMMNVIIYYFWGPKAFVYLLGGSLLGMGLHPVAGHFIAEHYVFHGDQETYSYYGPLNLVSFNVGYHNEHHDFPFIAGSRLPEVRKIAPEYYDNLHKYSSWVAVIWNYIWDDDVMPRSRIKRSTLSDKEIEELRSR